MTDGDRPLADQAAADVQEAVDAMVDATRIMLVRHAMKREHRREFVMQEAELEAQLLEREGQTDLASQLRRVAEGLRVLQPKVVATGQGDLQT